MAIQANRFNDPTLGAAFSNLAAAFAPPSAQDLVSYATAKAKKEDAERLAWLFSNPNDPLADRKATMAGVYAPTQSYYAVDQDTATTRRGQDVAAQTTLATNTENNRFGLAEQFMTPLSQGQVQPGLPADVASAFGIPALPRAEGMAKPLSFDETRAQERAALVENGMFTPEMQLEDLLGGETPVKVVGPDGQPIYSTPGAATRTGAPAYVDQGSQAAPDVENYRAPDGTSGTAEYVRDKGWVDTQTRQPLPAGSQTFKAATSGSVADALPSTTANQTAATRLKADVTSMNGLVNELETTINSQAGAAGLAANIQSFVQDGQQVVNELASALGENPDALVSGEALQDAASRVLGASGNYDPTFRRVQAMLLDLAYMNARMNNPSGEVSRAALEREIGALGQGLVGNDQSVLASLDVARSRMARALDQVAVLEGKSGGVTREDVLKGASPAPAPTGGKPATRFSFDAEGNPIP